MWSCVHLKASKAEEIASFVSLPPMHATSAIDSPVAGLYTYNNIEYTRLLFLTNSTTMELIAIKQGEKNEQQQQTMPSALLIENESANPSLSLNFAKKQWKKWKITAAMAHLYGFPIISIPPFPSNEALCSQQPRAVKLGSNTPSIYTHLSFKKDR